MIEPDASVRAVALFLGLCQKTVWKLIQRGELPSLRWCGAVRVPMKAVREERERRLAIGYKAREYKRPAKRAVS